MVISFRRLFTAVLIACAVLFAVPACAHAAKLNKTTLELLAGSSEQLSVKNAAGDVTWTSKKPSVASVDENGVVTGKKTGSCRIFATVAGKRYKCKVTVRALSGINTIGAIKGIDVSIYQGKINFKKVKKDGIGFVIMRAGYGMKVDSTFKGNYKRAKRNGLLVGCYWFITAQSESAARAQAKKCLKTIGKRSFDLPVFVDIESYSQFRKGKAFCSDIVSTFCDIVEDAGFKSGWYTSRSFVGPYLSDKVAEGSGYVAWVAEHGKTLHYDKVCDIWQFSHTGRVDGINTYVDLNWYFPNARAKEGETLSSGQTAAAASVSSSAGAEQSTQQTAQQSAQQDTQQTAQQSAQQDTQQTAQQNTQQQSTQQAAA